MGKKNLKRARNETGEEGELDESIQRKRQVTEDKLRQYKLYEDLAAESTEVRLKAAKEFIERFSPENHPDANSVNEALNRLIRGLCTQRKAARLGFCVTLTELLRQLLGQSGQLVQGLDLTVDSLLKRIERQTKPQGNVAGAERRDHLIGKLFAYKAIVQSSILIEPAISLPIWNELLDRIYGMARDVPWLREECGLIIVQAIELLGSKQGVESCARGIVERLVATQLVNTPEGVGIWLTLRTHFLSLLPSDIWHDSDPLSKREGTRLAKVLKEDLRNPTEDGEKQAVKSVTSHTNPSFAWDIVIGNILESDNKTEGKEGKSRFARFWLETVDAHVFALASSHMRKSWGLKLFAKQVCSVPDWAIAALFTPNVMRTLLNNTKKDDRFLQSAALSAWKALPSRAQQTPDSPLQLIIALTSLHGTADFDHPTKFKALDQILLAADDDALRKIVRHLHSLIIRPETAEQSVADGRRQNIVDLLLSIVRQYKRYDALASEIFAKDGWLRNVLEIMVEYAYFVPSESAKTRKVPLPAINDRSRQIFQERLSSCLTRLLHVETDSPVGLTAVQMIRSKGTSSRSLKAVFKADESINQAIETAFESFDDLTAKAKTDHDLASRGFLLLYTFTLLQVYNGDGDAVLMLQDLDSAYKAGMESAEEPATREQQGLVEVLLSFLGNPRTLFHEIAKDAFATFASSLGPEGLQALTGILDAEESLEGQKQLFAQPDEEGLGDSDVEMVDGDASGGDDSEDEDAGSDVSDSEDDSDDTSADDEEDDAELTQFNNMLALALQTSQPMQNGTEADDTSDESDMDDEQMMALDPQLAKIFEQRSQIAGKKERKDARQNMVKFKSRVLDLLGIFLDKQFSNPLILDALLPVLRLTRGSANKTLADKAAKLLKSTLETHAKQKTPLPEPGDAGPVLAVLQSIHGEAAAGGGANSHANCCSAASLLLVKVLVGSDAENYAKVADVYANSQKKWFANPNLSVQPGLFAQFLNWSTQYRSRNVAKKKV